MLAYVQRHRGRPLPVAAVGEVHHNAAALGHEAVDKPDVVELHAALYLGVGYVEQLYGLHYIVGEVAVELLLDSLARGLASVGEAGGEVVADDASAVARHIIYNEEEDVGEDIEHA